MESTCKMSCPFWKKYQHNCPHYIETTWMPHDESQSPKVIRDCAPKRSLILQLELHSKLEGMIVASNQERNINHQVLVSIHEAIELQKYPMIEMTPIPNGCTQRTKLLRQGNKHEDTDRQVYGKNP